MLSNQSSEQPAREVREGMPRVELEAIPQMEVNSSLKQRTSSFAIVTQRLVNSQETRTKSLGASWIRYRTDRSWGYWLVRQFLCLSHCEPNLCPKRFLYLPRHQAFFGLLASENDPWPRFVFLSVLALEFLDCYLLQKSYEDCLFHIFLENTTLSFLTIPVQWLCLLVSITHSWGYTEAGDCSFGSVFGITWAIP